ncbi:toprim domain-containing protein [Ruminococcus sp.]|uniref:toprim domain-containing protein n=1 Tax=Ruminococcus sp. TaxID=41978 RepID=UPI00387034E5
MNNTNSHCEDKSPWQSQPKIRLKETVIVEGRYDRIRLSELIESPMIETGGFRVFKDKEKQELIRAVAKRRGILVMTDVDSAGFVIRNFLRGIVPQEQILHAYIPTIKGKEKRKQEASKEGILGVEGIDRDALIESIRNSGAHILNGHCEEQNATWQSQPIFEPPFPKGGGAERRRVDTSSEITKSDFFDYGLSGCANAAQHREEVLTSLGLPTYLTTNAMISALNCLFTKDEFEQYLSQL